MSIFYGPVILNDGPSEEADKMRLLECKYSFQLYFSFLLFCLLIASVVYLETGLKLVAISVLIYAICSFGLAGLINRNKFKDKRAEIILKKLK